jgi:hypothetical protein
MNPINIQATANLLKALYPMHAEVNGFKLKDGMFKMYVREDMTQEYYLACVDMLDLIYARSTNADEYLVKLSPFWDLK